MFCTLGIGHQSFKIEWRLVLHLLNFFWSVACTLFSTSIETRDSKIMWCPWRFLELPSFFCGNHTVSGAAAALAIYHCIIHTVGARQLFYSRNTAPLIPCFHFCSMVVYINILRYYLYIRLSLKLTIEILQFPDREVSYMQVQNDLRDHTKAKRITLSDPAIHRAKPAVFRSTYATFARFFIVSASRVS